MTGSPVADLWVRIGGVDANVFAYLEDVAPDGAVTIVTEGRLKASLRTTQRAPYRLPEATPWHRMYEADATPLVDGQAYRLQFALLPASYVFKAGHRIQLRVTGSDYRERDQDIPYPAIQVLTGGAETSKLTLPVIAVPGAPG